MSTQWFNLDNKRDGYQESAARPWAITLVEKHRQGEVLNNVGRFITVELLTEELHKLNPYACAGSDGVTYKDLCLREQTEIPSLVKQLRGRRYKCKPSLRATIKKDDGTSRYLGIPCMRDKLAAAGIKAILEPVCEEMFSSHSYAYRPGLGCHHALADLECQLAAMQGGYILDLDVEKFFDRVSHAHLMTFIREMVSDPIILHAIREFLAAGTLIRTIGRGEKMYVGTAGQGIPQGGVISPLLANVYLHHVFDAYVINELSPSIPGGVSFVRYADDIVCLVKDSESAKRVREKLDKRFGCYGIPLHPLKSRTLDFRRPDLVMDREDAERSGFNFLGFRIEWEVTEAGIWALSKRIADGRVKKAVERSRVFLMKNLSLGAPVNDLRKALMLRVKGFQTYFHFEECGDGVQTYANELIKLFRNLALKEGDASIDGTPHSSGDLPEPHRAAIGAKYA